MSPEHNRTTISPEESNAIWADLSRDYSPTPVDKQSQILLNNLQERFWPRLIALKPGEVITKETTHIGQKFLEYWDQESRAWLERVQNGENPNENDPKQRAQERANADLDKEIDFQLAVVHTMARLMVTARERGGAVDLDVAQAEWRFLATLFEKSDKHSFYAYYLGTLANGIFSSKDDLGYDS